MICVLSNFWSPLSSRVPYTHTHTHIHTHTHTYTHTHTHTFTHTHIRMSVISYPHTHTHTHIPTHTHTRTQGDTCVLPGVVGVFFVFVCVRVCECVCVGVCVCLCACPIFNPQSRTQFVTRILGGLSVCVGTVMFYCWHNTECVCRYGVATISRCLKMMSFFCRI